MLSPKRAPSGGAEIAYRLSAGSIEGRITDWQALLHHLDHREQIDGGVRSVFERTVPPGELVRQAAEERDCCRFPLAITVDTPSLAFEVRAPDDARQIVESMFGGPR